MLVELGMTSTLCKNLYQENVSLKTTAHAANTGVRHVTACEMCISLLNFPLYFHKKEKRSQDDINRIYIHLTKSTQ